MTFILRILYTVSLWVISLLQNLPVHSFEGPTVMLLLQLIDGSLGKNIVTKLDLKDKKYYVPFTVKDKDF